MTNAGVVNIQLLQIKSQFQASFNTKKDGCAIMYCNCYFYPACTARSLDVFIVFLKFETLNLGLIYPSHMIISYINKSDN